MKMQRSLFTRLLSSPINHTGWVMIACILMLVGATLGAKNLYFRKDYNIFFDGTNPQLQAFDEIQATFNKTDNLAFVIAPENGNVFTEETLALVKEFTEDAWQIPYSSQVDSLSNYQHTEAHEDDLLVEDLLSEDYLLTPERSEKIRSIALTEPVLKNAIVS